MWHTVCFGSIDVGAVLQQVVISFPRVCQGAPTLFDNDNDSAECHLLITSLHSYSGHCLFFAAFVLSVFVLVLLCLCVATVYRRKKDLYIMTADCAAGAKSVIYMIVSSVSPSLLAYCTNFTGILCISYKWKRASYKSRIAPSHKNHAPPRGNDVRTLSQFRIFAG